MWRYRAGRCLAQARGYLVPLLLWLASPAAAAGVQVAWHRPAGAFWAGWLTACVLQRIRGQISVSLALACLVATAWAEIAHTQAWLAGHPIVAYWFASIGVVNLHAAAETLAELTYGFLATGVLGMGSDLLRRPAPDPGSLRAQHAGGHAAAQAGGAAADAAGGRAGVPAPEAGPPPHTLEGPGAWRRAGLAALLLASVVSAGHWVSPGAPPPPSAWPRQDVPGGGQWTEPMPPAEEGAEAPPPSPPPAPTPVPVTGRVMAQPALNVRAGPGTTYAILAQVLPGTEVAIVGTTPDQRWWQIRLPGEVVGWVSAQYVDAVTCAACVPARSGPSTLE
jgi:hypothetical protein